MVLGLNPTSSPTFLAEGNRLGQKTGNTILVVEDVAEIALHMKRRLIERGYNVVWAESAEDAIQVAEQNSLLMILSDVDLPAFDSLVERVRTHRALRELPVAILDINHPELPDPHVKVLTDFEALDNLVQSL